MTTVGLFWVMKNAGAQMYQPLGEACPLYQMWKGHTIGDTSSMNVAVSLVE